MKACAGEPVPTTVSGSQQRAGEPACPSVASHSRVLIEFCCGPDSKLGDRSRKIQKIVMSSDVRKREMLRLDRIEWTLEMKLFMQLKVQLFNLVLSCMGLASHALVAQHGHM